MQIIDDPKLFRPLVETAIAEFGFAPEHNLEWFFNYADDQQKPVAVVWSTGEVVLAYSEADVWYTFSEPLAPSESRGQRFAEVAAYALAQAGIEKVIVEARENTRSQLIEHLSADLKIVDDGEENYTLIWPIMNMRTFDPTLPGGHFKYLRNAKSKFYREHVIEIKDAAMVNKEALRGLIDRWVPIATEREGEEFMHEQPYYNLIETDFVACATARAMLANGVIVGLNAGWEIPHSDGGFCAAIGIHDYSIKDLGLMLYLEDLTWIKNAGYAFADMEGVEEGAPLNFKKQFLPESYYRTDVLSIVKK